MRDDVILQRAANYFIEQTNLPSSSEVVDSLLEAEKIAKKEKISYDWENLIGTWRRRKSCGDWWFTIIFDWAS